MRSLRARVTIATVVSAALVLALAGGVGVGVYAENERQELDERLVRESNDHEMILSRLEPFEAAPVGCCHEGQVSTTVWAARRKNPILETGLRYPRAECCGHRNLHQGESHHRVYVTDASFGFGRKFGDLMVQSTVSTSALEERIERLRNRVIAAVAAGTLLVGLPAWLLAGLALGSVARIREGATRLAETGDLSQRLPQEGAPEIVEMGRSLNRMIDRLEHSYGQARSALDATRTFTADAGHELRTPLTSLRANLDVLARDDLGADDRERALRDSLRAHERLTALIEGLQTLARGDADAVAARSAPVDLVELADAAVIDARRRHPEVEFEFEGSAAGPAQGDPDGLRMLLDNLLENAAVHGGRRVRVHVRHGDRYVRLSVDDDGPGIPDAEKGRVFERFARGSGARNGTGSGLGLAIAAQQAELHGGRLKLEDSPLGGARFELTLSALASS